MHTDSSKAKWQLSTESWMNKCGLQLHHKTVFDDKGRKSSHRRGSQSGKRFHMGPNLSLGRTYIEQQGDSTGLLGWLQCNPENNKMGPGMSGHLKVKVHPKNQTGELMWGSAYQLPQTSLIMFLVKQRGEGFQGCLQLCHWVVTFISSAPAARPASI